MAIIGNFRARNGVTVSIHDDCMATDPKEIAAAKARMDEAVYNIIDRMVRDFGVDGAIEKLEQAEHDREERNRKYGPPLTPISETETNCYQARQQLMQAREARLAYERRLKTHGCTHQV